MPEDSNAGFDVAAFESRVATKAKTPVFARLALHYLREGRAHQAIELCEAGLKLFPAYSTGHLVLGKCYESLGRDIEAMISYRRALKAVPDNLTVRNLVQKVERSEEKAFRAFLDERQSKMMGRKNTIMQKSYFSEESSTRESAFDFLVKRLQDVQKITPRPDEGVPLREPEGAGFRSKIVSATLAEIYTSQQEYTAAIEAYTKLIEQHPSQAERYRKRIAEIEELVKLQGAEPKG